MHNDLQAESTLKVSSEEILHFDMIVHQVVKHPMCCAKWPVLVVQTYNYVLVLNVATMSMQSLFALSVTHPDNPATCRLNLPNICLQTILFDEQKPYLYVLDEN